MTIPFELADTARLSRYDANEVSVTRKFFYSDLSPLVGINPFQPNLVDFDESAVAGQIELVIGTPIGSEPHEPTFGCNATLSVFDNMNQANLNTLELEILTSLKRWLGNRLDFFSVSVKPDRTSGQVIVEVPYRIRATGVASSYIGSLSVNRSA